MLTKSVWTQETGNRKVRHLLNLLLVYCVTEERGLMCNQYGFLFFIQLRLWFKQSAAAFWAVASLPLVACLGRSLVQSRAQRLGHVLHETAATPPPMSSLNQSEKEKEKNRRGHESITKLIFSTLSSGFFTEMECVGWCKVGEEPVVLLTAQLSV